MKKLTKNDVELFENYYRRKDNKKPVCLEDELFPLVIKRQNETITETEDNELGYWLMSIAKILNNHYKCKYRDDDFKEEFTFQAIYDMLNAIPHYDKDKISKRTGKTSKAYSYLFRIAYVSLVHCLEKQNEEIQMISVEDLKESDIEQLIYSI